MSDADADAGAIEPLAHASKATRDIADVIAGADDPPAQVAEASDSKHDTADADAGTDASTATSSSPPRAVGNDAGAPFRGAGLVDLRETAPCISYNISICASVHLEAM